jgi:ATP-dependent Clp protease protease subunit
MEPESQPQAQPQPQAPTTIYATFSGTIDQMSLPRLFAAFNLAVNNKVENVHLLFQSTGGMIADGISLYNYLNALPINLFMYNTGSVQSVAVIAYLAGTVKYVSRHANFMIHKSHLLAPENANAARYGDLVEYLSAEDARLETILKDETSIPADKWALHASQNVHFTAQEAVDYDIADQIKEFVIPAGCQVYNL